MAVKDRFVEVAHGKVQFGTVGQLRRVTASRVVLWRVLAVLVSFVMHRFVSVGKVEEWQLWKGGE